MTTTFRRSRARPTTRRPMGESGAVTSAATPASWGVDLDRPADDDYVTGEEDFRITYLMMSSDPSRRRRRDVRADRLSGLRRRRRFFLTGPIARGIRSMTKFRSRGNSPPPGGRRPCRRKMIEMEDRRAAGIAAERWALPTPTRRPVIESDISPGFSGGSPALAPHANQFR